MMTRNFNDLVPNVAATAQTGVTAGAAAVTLASLFATPLAAGTDAVLLALETDQIRLSPTGTVPTSTLGILIEPGQVLWLTRAEFDVARVIRVTADVRLQIAEYKNR